MHAACGVTAAPSLNTGFVWARAGKPRTIQLFNETVHTILRRMAEEPIRDANGLIHQGRLWPQAVMNEVTYRHAKLPKSWAGGRVCHPKDIDCLPWKLPSKPLADGVMMPMNWWIDPPREHSVWLASSYNGRRIVATSDEGLQSEKEEVYRPYSTHAFTDDDLGLGEHLIAHTELGGGTRLAVLPRPLVGRLCGRRKVPLSALLQTNDTVRPVACTDLTRPTLLGQSVQHLQFTNSFTRQRVFAAMHWSGAASSASAPSISASCQSLEDMTNKEHGVLISSAVALLLCLSHRQ